MSTSDASDRAPLRWGIAATGSIAATMCEALATVDDAEVVAVGSRTRARADDFASRFSIPRAHGDYEALWADPDVDIVYVASPHSHHHEMTIAALDAGKHVLCEKAFAVNADQAREMVDAADRSGRFLMEAMWTWFIPAVIDIRRRIGDGEIGDLKLIVADFGIPVHEPEGRHRRLDLAGGALLDLGIYPISFARHLAGLITGTPAAAVDSIAVTGTLGDTGVDSSVAGVVTFAGGVTGMFHTTLDFRTSLRATIHGTAGHIDVDAPFWFPTRFTVRPNDGTEPTRVELAHRGLAHEAIHAMERIRAGHLESDVVPLATTIETMELLDEIRHRIGVVYPEER